MSGEGGRCKRSERPASSPVAVLPAEVVLELRVLEAAMLADDLAAAS